MSAMIDTRTAARPSKTSPATRPKLDHFGAIINELISIWKRPGKLISEPWAHDRAIHIDLHAATGDGVEGRDGSALIALRNMLANDLSFESWLCERNRLRCVELRENILAMLQAHRQDVLEGELRAHRQRLGRAARHGPCVEVCPVCHPSDLAAWIAEHIHIVVGDHNETIDDILVDLRRRLTKDAFGLVVADPYGISDLGDGPLIKLSREPRLQRVDQLINVSATAAKRGGFRHGGFRPVYERLAPIQKKRCLVRETLPGEVDRGWHWTMFVYSNWLGGPNFTQLGFHDTVSPEGKQLLDRFGITHRERNGTAPIVTPPHGEATYRSYAEYLAHPRFRAVCAAVFARCGGFCERCKVARAKEPHHLRYPPWGQFDTEENLLAVCHPCHCEIHGKET